MGKNTETPIIGAVQAPVIVCLEDEVELGEMFVMMADLTIGPVRMHRVAADAERELVEALIEGHRRFVFVSDVQVCPEIGGDKGQSVSDDLCSRASSGELFGGADVTVEVVRMSGNPNLQLDYGARSGIRFLAKPFQAVEMTSVIGEAILGALKNVLSPFRFN